MGYTHYFKAEKELNLEEKQRKLLKQVLEEHSDILQGWEDADGLIGPMLTDDSLNINGIGDDSHENLLIQFGEKFDFNFCKTATKPYDLPVMKCLIILATLDGFTFSSDGDEEDWQEGLDWARNNKIHVLREDGRHTARFV